MMIHSTDRKQDGARVAALAGMAVTWRLASGA